MVAFNFKLSIRHQPNKDQIKAFFQLQQTTLFKNHLEK
jgi:hypothetical protein